MAVFTRQLTSNVLVRIGTRLEKTDVNEPDLITWNQPKLLLTNDESALVIFTDATRSVQHNVE
jgi:hypothetical protein